MHGVRAVYTCQGHPGSQHQGSGDVVSRVFGWREAERYHRYYHSPRASPRDCAPSAAAAAAVVIPAGPPHC